MKNKLNLKMKGHVNIKIDGQTLSNNHNEIQSTALESIANRLVATAPNGIDKVELYTNGPLLVEFNSTPISAIAVGSQITIVWEWVSTVSFNLTEVLLIDRASNTTFSSFDLALTPLPISSGQLITLTWVITLTL